MNNNRIEFVDLAKGICIILIVIGHCGVNISIPSLGIVRMPLYFLIRQLQTISKALQSRYIHFGNSLSPISPFISMLYYFNVSRKLDFKARLYN